MSGANGKASDRIVAQLRGEIAALHEQLYEAKAMARRCWNMAVDRLLERDAREQMDDEDRRVIDPAFDAAMTLFERERIEVSPCRRILDEQVEIYSVKWPGGELKLIDRAQLLMMGGRLADPRPALRDEDPL